jgi:DNA replication protein DnaC
VGKTHLAIALGRAVVEAGHSVLFTSATALLAALSKAETDGQLSDRLMFYTKPKLLIIDELGYLPFERRSAHLFFQLVARRYERGSLLITESDHSRWSCELRDHGEPYGVPPYLNPTRTSREMAIAWAEEERKHIEAYTP